MGSTNFKITKLALAMGVTLGLSGCFSDNDNNVEIKPPVVEPPTTVKVPVSDTKEALSFYVNANVIDATAAELTVVENVTVKFFENGVASTNIVDVAGNEITAEGITSETGSFTFNVKEDAEISEVTLIVSAADYFNKSTVVDFGDKDEIIDTFISLAKKETLVTAEKTVTTTEGRLNEALEAKTDDGAVSVAVSTETELQDADGNAISGDEVTVSVVTAPLSAEAGKASAVDIIPAGFQEVTNEVATEVAVPKAYFEVNMSAGDTAIKKFGAPITLTTNVSGDFTEGDKLTVTSFNEDTGVWTKEEQQATVGAQNELVFPASFGVDHLTGFLLSSTANACDKDITYSIEGVDVSTLSRLSASIRFTDGNSNFIQHVYPSIFTQTGTIFPQSALKRLGITKDSKVSFYLYHGPTGERYSDTLTTEACSEIKATAVQPEIEYVDTSIAMSFSCSNADDTTTQLPLTGAVVYYRQQGKPTVTVRQTTNSATYNLDGLVSGKEYTVTVDTRIPGFTVAPITFTAGEDVTPQNFVRDNCVVEDKEVTGTGSGS